jgi:hypothetical protein
MKRLSWGKRGGGEAERRGIEGIGGSNIGVNNGGINTITKGPVI